MQFQVISILPLEGIGISWAEVWKNKEGGWGGLRKKSIPRGRYRYFLELHIVQINLPLIFFRILFFISFLLWQKGYRSLHTAARKDFAKAAKLLLQKDHKPDIEAPVSCENLWCSCQTKFCKIDIRTIYMKGMQKVEIVINNILQNGFTPLHIAAKYGNQNVAGVLIQHGATIDYKTKV